MKTLLQAAHEIQHFLRAREWPFCFIGGIAVLAWGRPRLTVDVDVSLFTGYANEDPFITGLLGEYAPRIPDALDFARRTRVLLIQSPEGIGIDVVLSALPYEAEVVERAIEKELLPGVPLRVCRADDLIVLKAFASRTQDWADVESIVLAQGASLDVSYIMARLKPLAEAKQAPDILLRAERLLAGRTLP